MAALTRTLLDHYLWLPVLAGLWWIMLDPTVSMETPELWRIEEHDERN